VGPALATPALAVPLLTALPSFFSVVLLLPSIPRLDDVRPESGCC
jgi:hypothetical protein